MRARFADGRAAITHEADYDLGADAITVRTETAQYIWRYQDLRRADDGAHEIVLKRTPDTGERLTLEQVDEAALRAAAPDLFKPAAFGVERPRTIIALTAGAWSLAAAFLVGVPLLAEPLAGIVPPRYRERIADISWSQVEAISSYCDDSDEAARILNDVAYRMMTAADVPQRDDIWITIVDTQVGEPFPNAFALPDNSIVVTADLIELAEHPDEITGVIAHEIAHIEHNHVMQNIIRSVGAGIFFDIVFGGAGAGQAVAIASVNLAGLRYSRGDEADADARGLAYLDAANIDTGGLARLFDRLAREIEGEEGAEMPTLFSSHPATLERAEVARARSRPGLAPSMSDAEWQIVRRACGGVDIPAEQTPIQLAPAPNPNPAPAPRGDSGDDVGDTAKK